VVNYVNTTGGEIAMSSSPVAASQGFLPWTIDSAWLRGLSSNNVTLYLNEVNPTIGDSSSLGGKNFFHSPYGHTLPINLGPLEAI
jgi:hypothetical protein